MRWEPQYGPQVEVLGRLGPDEEQAATARLSAIGVLLEQAREDIITLSQMGEPVDLEMAEYDALWQRAATLQAQILDLDPGALDAWNSEAATVEAQVRELIARVVRRRRGAPERRALAGLGWGVGAAAIAAAVAYGVWMQRPGQKRRRRLRAA